MGLLKVGDEVDFWREGTGMPIMPGQHHERIVEVGAGRLVTHTGREVKSTSRWTPWAEVHVYVNGNLAPSDWPKFVSRADQF